MEIPTCVADIVKLQRAIHHASDDLLKQVILSLNSKEMRWLIHNYLKHFVPYHHHQSLKSRESISINKIHWNRLYDISNNHKDLSLLGKIQALADQQHVENDSLLLTKIPTETIYIHSANILFMMKIILDQAFQADVTNGMI